MAMRRQASEIRRYQRVCVGLARSLSLLRIISKQQRDLLPREPGGWVLARVRYWPDCVGVHTVIIIIIV